MHRANNNKPHFSNSQICVGGAWRRPNTSANCADLRVGFLNNNISAHPIKTSTFACSREHASGHRRQLGEAAI